MSLKDFQTILTPQEKVGALAFYQKPTPGFPQGRIFPATFSRPDVGATSGATVFDKDGNLEELAEDAPDWEQGSGCTKILMRPQAQNLWGYSGDVSNFYNPAPATLSNEGPLEIFPQDDWGLFTQNGAGNNIGIIYSLLTAGQNYIISFYVKISASDDYIGLRETGNGVGVFRISTETITTAGGGLSSGKVLDTTNPDIKRVVLYGTAGVGGNLFLVLCSTAGNSGVDDGGKIQITGLQVQQTSVYSGYIPTSGAALTRSANDVILSNMVSNEVFGAGSVGSIIIKLKGYTGDSTPLSNFLLDSSGDTLLNLVMRDYGATVFKYQDTSSPTTNTHLALNDDHALVYVFDGLNMKIYADSGLVLDFDAVSYQGDIDQFTFPKSPNGQLDYSLVGITPIALTEAQAIAAIAEAESL